MAKFRRKPIVIDAWLWDGRYEAKTTPKWVMEGMQKEGSEIGSLRIVNNDVVRMISEDPIRPQILTAFKGDYVIRGPKGELYPCKAEIFHLLHDEVE